MGLRLGLYLMVKQLDFHTYLRRGILQNPNGKHADKCNGSMTASHPQSHLTAQLCK